MVEPRVRGEEELDTASPLVMAGVVEPTKAGGRDTGAKDVGDRVGTTVRVDWIRGLISVGTPITLEEERKRNGIRLELG